MKKKEKKYKHYEYAPEGGSLIVRERKEGLVYYARIYTGVNDKGKYTSKEVKTNPVILLRDRGKNKELKEFLDREIEKNKKEQELITEQKELAKQKLSNPISELENISVVDFLYKYIKDFKEEKLELLTIEGYKGYVKSFEEFLNLKGYENILMKNLTGYIIDQYNIYLKNEKKLKETTLKRHSDILRPAVKQAKRWKIVKENIWDDVNTEIYKSNVNEMPDRISFEPKDKDKFYAIIKGHKLENIFKLAFLLGLRRSEILGLRWSQIDFEKGTLLLKGSVQKHNKEFIIREDKNKWASGNRLYDGIEDIKDILLSIKEQIENNKRKFGNCYNYKHKDFLCVNELGILYNPDNITDFASNVADKMGVKKVDDKINNLMRHMAATILYSITNNIGEVSEFLRHTDIRTTMKYLHIKNEAIITSVSTLARLGNEVNITA